MYISTNFIKNGFVTTLFVGVSSAMFTSVNIKTGSFFGALTYTISLIAANTFNKYMPLQMDRPLTNTFNVIDIELSAITAKLIISFFGYRLTIRQMHQILGSVGITFILCCLIYALSVLSQAIFAKMSEYLPF